MAFSIRTLSPLTRLLKPSNCGTGAKPANSFHRITSYCHTNFAVRRSLSSSCTAATCGDIAAITLAIRNRLWKSLRNAAR